MGSRLNPAREERCVDNLLRRATFGRRRFLKGTVAAAGGLAALLTVGATEAQTKDRERTLVAAYNPADGAIADAFAQAGNPTNLLVMRHTKRGWKAYSMRAPIQQFSDFQEGPYILSSSNPSELERFVQANDLTTDNRSSAVERQRRLLNANKGWILGTWKAREIETSKMLNWHRATQAYAIPTTANAQPRTYDTNLPRTHNRRTNLETIRTGQTLWINIQEHAKGLPTYFYAGNNYGPAGDLEPWMHLDPETVFHLWSRIATNYQDTRESEEIELLKHHNTYKWGTGVDIRYKVQGNATEHEIGMVERMLEEIEMYLNWYASDKENLNYVKVADSDFSLNIVYVRIPQEEWFDYLPEVSHSQVSTNTRGAAQLYVYSDGSTLARLQVFTSDQLAINSRHSLLQELYHTTGLANDFESHDLDLWTRSIVDDLDRREIEELSDLDKAMLALHGHYVIKPNDTPEQARAKLEEVGWFEQ